MSRRWLVALTLVLAAVSAVAGASGNDRLDDWRVVEDSLRTMHPRYRARWLRDHDHADRPQSFSSSSDSGPLQVVGRWSCGPAYDVDCRVTATDTLIALGRGSGVSLLSFNRTRTPRVEFLSDVNAERLLNQVMIRDSLLYVGTNAGLETYDISDARNPERLSWIRTGCAGFDVSGSLAFITWYDTFKVYSIADPASPYRVGWCLDSGATVSVAGGTAFLADWGGLYAVDVSDPSVPHRVGSWGNNIWCAQARGNICCLARGAAGGSDMSFVVLDVSDPENMFPLGSASNAGGEDIHLDGPRAYVSGRYMYQTWFQLIDIGDSTHPTVLGRCTLPGYKHGAWGKSGLDRSMVANDLDGLVLIDVSNPSDPSVDSLLLGGGYTLDIELDGTRAYVANGGGGMKVLDVSDPTRPLLLGSYDTPGIEDDCYSVAARDSFAYVGWFNAPLFRSLDVSDPARPQLAGTAEVTNNVEASELRDSLVYCAENYRFQVVNVARPREPRVVGMCNLPERSQEVILDDTLAYVANYGGIIVTNVARPDSSYVTATWPRYIWGIDLQDTVLYALSYTSPTEDVIISLSVADPNQPYVLDSLVIPRTKFDVLVVDTIAYCGGWELDMVSVANPRDLRLIEGRWVPPSLSIHRLVYESPYIYVAATDGGVCILETLQTGLSEMPGSKPAPVLRVWPSVTTGMVRVVVNAPVAQASVEVCDIAGAVVFRSAACATSGQELDLSQLPAGVYVVSVRTPYGGSLASKVLVVRRR